MALSRLRTTSLIIASATLCSNALSSLLFHHFPDDPYHISSNFSSYLYFANIVSILGLIGSLNRHALSISIFSNYLIIDTILCAIPRILVLSMLSNLGASFCEPDDLTLANSAAVMMQEQGVARTPDSSVQEISIGGGIWVERKQCSDVVLLAQAAMSAGVVAATLLQFIGALQVREYGKRLAVNEMRADRAVVLREGEDIDVEEKEYLYMTEFEGFVGDEEDASSAR